MIFEFQSKAFTSGPDTLAVICDSDFTSSFSHDP
jgi:hypothetical protein